MTGENPFDLLDIGGNSGGSGHPPAMTTTSNALTVPSVVTDDDPFGIFGGTATNTTSSVAVTSSHHSSSATAPQQQQQQQHQHQHQQTSCAMTVMSDQQRYNINVGNIHGTSQQMVANAGSIETSTSSSTTTAAAPSSGGAANKKWPSMLKDQWTSGCNNRQPSRQYMVICAKNCTVPGGIETLMRRGGNSASGGPSSSSSSAAAARNEQMILQIQNGGDGAGASSSRNAAYPDMMNMANPVSGSLTNKARNLAGRFTKAAKGAVDMAERNISSMAIKAAAAHSNDPSKVPVDIVTAVVFISQPILSNYPGSAKFEEYTKTEPKRLDSSNSNAYEENGGDNSNSYNDEEDEVVWSLPVLLPPALSPQEQEQGKDRLVQIRIQMKSSAALTSKQYLVGSGTFSLSHLLSGVAITPTSSNNGQQQQSSPKSPPQYHFKSPLQSNVLNSSSGVGGAAVELFVLGNRKYPPLGGMGWSATDPLGDYCGAMNSPYCPPLEQLYALKKSKDTQPTASSSSPSSTSSTTKASFPYNVVLATERTQESTVVLPLSTAMTRLLAEAAMHSAQHADSVARRLKSNALRFRDPIEALDENRHAECILDLCHLTRFASSTSNNSTAAGGGMCQVRIALQAPDCVFERPICASQVPVLLGNGGPNAQPHGNGRIHTTFPFYPKRHPIMVSDGVGGKRMSITLGTLRFEVRVEGGPSPTSVATGGGRMSPTGGNNSATSIGSLWEGYANMDQFLDKPGGTFMEVPMFVASLSGTGASTGAGAGGSGAPIATLMIKLTARSPPPRGSSNSHGGLTSGQVLVPSQKGLFNLLNMKPLYGNGLLDNDGYKDYSSSPATTGKTTAAADVKLGDFFAMEWMDQYAKKRHLDAGTLVSRYESYKLALSRPGPQLSTTPVHQRKCPSWFRPSSAKTEFLLSGIPFNTHVQALVVEPLTAVAGSPSSAVPSMTWHNITCGAAADHPRGFTNAAPPASSSPTNAAGVSNSNNEKPGGAGGVRRLEQKREELAKLYTDSEQKLRLAVLEYLQKHSHHRKYVPVDEPYVAHHRATCFRISQRLAELNWEIVKRRGNLLCQVLGQGITAYLAAVSDNTRCNDKTAQRWLQHGFLLTYEGLLSAAGKETAMIEDAYSAIDMLQHVQIELVDAGPAAPPAANNGNSSPSGPLGPKSINIVGSRVIRAIEIVRYEGDPDSRNGASGGASDAAAPLMDLLGDMSVSTATSNPTEGSTTSTSTTSSVTSGQGGSLLVRVSLDSSYYQHRVPSTLRAKRIRFYAMLFQMGVDIMQWGANATSKMGGGGSGQQQQGGVNISTNNASTTSQRTAATLSNSSRQESISSSGSSSSFNADDDDVDGGRGDEDNDLLVALNNEAFRKLNKYAFKVNPVNVDPNVATIIPNQAGGGNGGGVTIVHPMLQRLWQNICDSANKMEHGVLDAAGAAASELGGSGVIFCKSGKDRTAMQATLKQSQFLALKANVRPKESSHILKDATLMRMYGTRLPICEKNVGQPKYAFNALQAKFMPEQLKPPLESVAGFLKGGSLFSRTGAIES